MSYTHKDNSGSGAGSRLRYGRLSSSSAINVNQLETPDSTESRSATPHGDQEKIASSVRQHENIKGGDREYGHKPPSQSVHGAVDLSFIWMVLWFLLGLVSCVLHHIFNQSRHGKVVEGDGRSLHSLQNQRVVVYIGTAFAFVIKAFYAFSLNLAYQQVVWAVWNRKSSTVEAMDNVISLPEDATKFLDGGLWRHAKRPICIAMLIWLLPLGTLFGPGTISVVRGTLLTNSTEQVPTLDFLAIELKSPHGSIELAQPPRPYDTHYTGVSYEMEKLVALTAYSGFIQPGPGSPCGLNCTYTIKFPGPAQKCEYIANYTLEESNPWHDGNVSSNPVYEAGGRIITYYDTKPVESSQNTTKSTKAVDLWVSWASRQDPEDEIPEIDEREFPAQKGAPWELRTIRCIDYNATYTVEVSYVNGVEYLRASLEYLHETNYLHDQSGFSLLYPQQGGYARDVGGVYLHRAVKESLINTLQGSITMFGGAASRAPGVGSSISKTNLARRYRTASGLMIYLAIPDLKHGIEQLAVNLTLSMLGTSDLVYRDPDGASAMVQRSEVRNEFRYTPRNMIISYALLTGLTGISVILGLVVATHNGFWGSVNFSTMYLAMRERELWDEGGDESTERLLKTKFMMKYDRDGRAYFMQVERVGGKV